MSAPLPVARVPRPAMPQQYDYRIVEAAMQALERDLAKAFKRDRDLALEPGKRLVLASQGTNRQFALGLASDDRLVLIDYATGTESDFVLRLDSVEGLAQALADLETAWESADAALQAQVTLNANAIADAEGAIGSLESEITAARDGETSLLAKISSVETTAVDAETAAAAAQSEIAAARDGEASLLAKITAVETAIASGDSAIASDVTTLQASVFSPGRNVIPDPQNLLDTWTSTSPSELYMVDDEERGRCFYAESTTAVRVFQTPIFDLPDAGGGTWTISYELENASGVNVYCDVIWYDASNANVKDGGQSSTSSNGADLSTRWEWTDTVPATAVKARARVVVASGASGPVYVRRIKLERGSPATPWSDDSADALIGASVVTQAGAIADIEGGAAFWETEVAASGSDPAIVSLKAGKDGSEVGLAAKILRLINSVGGTTIEVMRAIGGYVFFSNPISIDVGGKRLTLGGTGLLLWFGSDTVDPPSQTTANSDFALGTDGKQYFGGTQRGTQAIANHQRGATYSGTPTEGSWWADTTASELKLYTGGSWQTVANIVTPSPTTSWTVGLLGSTTGLAAAGQQATISLSVSSQNEPGNLSYLWQLETGASGVSSNNAGTSSSIQYYKTISNGENSETTGSVRVVDDSTKEVRVIPFTLHWEAI